MSAPTDVAPPSEADTSDLRLIARIMVPADAQLGVPGADDDLIFADIVSSLGQDREMVHDALASIRRFAGVTRLGDLDDPSLVERVDAWRHDNHAASMLLVRVVVQCYYRDDRVVRALGLQPRAPFPLGHEVTEVDTWSLLDDVRARGRIWRDAPG